MGSHTSGQGKGEDYWGDGGFRGGPPMGEYYGPYVRSFERAPKYPHQPPQYHPYSHHAQYPPPPMAPPPYGFPGGDGGGKRASPALIAVIIVIVMVLMVPIAVMYVWFIIPPDPDIGVTLLNLSGRIEVDNHASTINVSLTHSGGDPIRWNDILVTVGGVTASGNPINPVTGRTATTTNVGETAMWTVDNMAGTYEIGSQYTIKIIRIEDSSIAWQKDITAVSAR